MTRALSNRLGRLEDRLGLGEVDDDGHGVTPEQSVRGRAAYLALVATREGPLSRERGAEIDARLLACPKIVLSAEAREQLASTAASVGKPAPVHYGADGAAE